MKSFFKQPREDKAYLKWIKTQPCANPNCPGGCGQVVPSHERILGNAGMGIKPPDKDALPLGKLCHDLEHHKGAVTFWGQGTKAKTKVFVQSLCDEHIKLFEEG